MAALLAAGCGFAQERHDFRRDAATFPNQSLPYFPGTCGLAQTLVRSDQTPGSNMYICGPDFKSWVSLSSGGGGGTVSVPGAASVGLASDGSGTGFLPTTGCTYSSTGGGMFTCLGGFSGGSGPWSVTGACQTSAAVGTVAAGQYALFFDSANSCHLTRKDSSAVLVDLQKPVQTARVIAYEVGAENASAAFVTGDLTSHSISINDANAKTLTEASCVSDAGSQVVVVKVGTTTLFTLTCVASGSYSRATTDGSTGYIIPASMTSTAVAAGAQLDLSGTANGTSKDIKLMAYGTVN